ncbi:tetratricopeptide repeat protein [Granulicella sp. 5B5]|uniref:tetratricopeptide repeat protein n=1 Tax=Granulicella sp. 5B5 TaxID=1617967 RepID=UPI00176103EA|nr:tetratricopeptide repeat protein [Granulicella sp. 5B5]QMV19929.1 tetratricopeptide repeat protein [Granulicella sp. 5B5]
MVGVLVLLAVMAAYANSFENAFHFDDFHTVTDNPAVRSMGNVPRFFTDATLFSVLPANRTYRPAVSASLAFDYALGHGYVPFWFHLSTFVWFVILLGCLFLLYEDILQRTEPSSATPWLALGTVAWFGLHPAMAETVNYVIQRGDVYCTLGCVAALVVWIRWPRLRRWGLYLLPFVVALLSKPPAAVFPVLLMAYVWFFEAGEGVGRGRKSAVAMLPSLAVTVAGLWLQSAMTPKSFAPSILSPWAYRLTQPYVWLRYFGELFLPVHLNVDSDLQPFGGLNARALAGLVFTALLLVAIWWSARKKRLYPVAFGLIWFVVTQIPTSVYALSEVENDHRMFFSFPGLMLAVVWTAWLALERVFGPEKLPRVRTVGVVCVVLLLAAYAHGVMLRNQVWHTEESLWRDNVVKSPHNGRGLMIYGLTQMNKGAYAEALEYFTRALRYTPNYPTLEINLGVVYGAMGRQAQAEQHFERAALLGPKDDQTHAFYGRWLLAQGRIAEAVVQERAAVALDPARPMNHDLLLMALQQAGDEAAMRQAAVETLRAVPGDTIALAMLRGRGMPASSAAAKINASLTAYRTGEYAKAIAEAQQALALDPRSALAYNNIGAAYGAMARWDDAIANVNKALVLDPTLQIAKNNLTLYEQKKQARAGTEPMTAAEWINRSLALNQAGNFEASLQAAQQALTLDMHSAEAWNNIAAANEAMHRWDDAIAAAKKAIALKPDFQLAKNNLAWSESQKKLEQH